LGKGKAHMIAAEFVWVGCGGCGAEKGRYWFGAKIWWGTEASLAVMRFVLGCGLGWAFGDVE